MASSPFATESLTPSQLQDLIRDSTELLLLDLRKNSEFEASNATLSGAQRWNYHDGQGLPAAALQAKARSTPVVAFCAKGTAVSQDGVRRLRGMGFQAVFLEGGLSAWRAEGRTIQHKAHHPTSNGG